VHFYFLRWNTWDTKFPSHPTKKKVRTIVEAPAPQNVSQLKSFLGMFNTPVLQQLNLLTVLAPLCTKTEHGSGKQHNKQPSLKQRNCWLPQRYLYTVMHIYKPLVLSCDASPYGMGGVLSYKQDDCSKHPVTFAFQIPPAEKRYSQLDKEGLAIIFGVKRFHYYFLGRKLKIFSDHKPLQHLFGRSKPCLQCLL